MNMPPGRIELKQAAAIALLALSGNAMALEIGALKVESHLGEAFKASISVIPSPGETVDASCVSLDQTRIDDGIFQLTHANLAVGNGGRLVRITTGQSINEPILTLRLDVHCGTVGEIGKSFTVFLDPVAISPPVVRQPEETPLAAPEKQAAREKKRAAPREAAPRKAENAPTGGTITVKPNDTLSGIAYGYFPNDRQARRHFIASVLEENPGLSPNLIRAGSVLNIPELKSKAEPSMPPKAEPGIAAVQKKQPQGKPAFQLDIVSGEAKTGENQDLKRTETQLITRADDQAVQMMQLKSQIKALEGKLSELQHRVVAANKLLARISEARLQPRSETKPVSNLVWIIVLLVLMGAGGVVYWVFRRKKVRAEEALLDQYLNPTLSKPALIDHLDYFESDTPDHHKW